MADNGGPKGSVRPESGPPVREADSRNAAIFAPVPRGVVLVWLAAMRTVLSGYLLTALLLWARVACAQQPAADTSQTVLASLQQRYTATQGYNLRLYNGPEYVNYVRRYVKGHQFFGTNELRLATIDYDGATYPDIPLRYDLVRGQVILKAPLGALELHLVNEHLTRFTLAGHTFVRLLPTTDNGLPATTRFYDLLLDGPTPVLVARSKKVLESMTPDGAAGEVVEQNEVLVGKAGHYYPVSKASAVLRLFPENRAALRKYIKDKSLKFNAQFRENSIVELVRYQRTLAPVGQ